VVKVALLQLRLQETKQGETIINHIIKLLKKLGDVNLDIVCLPELWYSKPINNFEKEFKMIIDIAKEQSLIIIPGAFLETINGNLHISSPVIASDGLIMGRQFKIHPFADERNAIKTGTKLETFDFGGGGRFKFGIAICYDVVFPEVSRALARKGADIIFFPSRIRNEGIKPWHMYVHVRALENRIAAAAPNVSSNIYGGKSIVIGFDYHKKSDIAIPKPVIASSVKQQILVTDVDLELARRIRKTRLEDFKGDLYSSL
jgi:omega-amidase